MRKMDMIKDYSDITLKSIKDDTPLRKGIFNIICDILDHTNDKVIYYVNDGNILLYITKCLMNKYGSNDIKLCCSKFNRNIKNEKDMSLCLDLQDVYDASEEALKGRCILTTMKLDYQMRIADKSLKHVIVDITDFDGMLQIIDNKHVKTSLTVYINEQNKVKIKNVLNQYTFRYNNISLEVEELLKNIDIFNSFLTDGVLQTIYKRLQHAGIKLDADYKYNELLAYLQKYSSSEEFINKDYVKSLLSDIGKPAKQINKVNEALKQLKIPYIITNNRKRIDGSNSLNLWYVKELSNE